MKNYARRITIVAAILVLPMLLILQITQAKRSTSIKSPPKQPVIQPNADRATLPTGLSGLMQPQSDSLAPLSTQAVGFAVSREVRDLPSDTKFNPDDVADNEPLKTRPPRIFRTEVAGVEGSLDPVVQQSAPQTTAIPSPAQNFDGISNTDNAAAFGFRVSPPDTDGDVGPNHYVQQVNLLVRVFSKAGAPLTAPFKLSSLWATVGGECAAEDAGDPIVLYDPLADRWLLSQFAFATSSAPPYHQCIAVSQTSDPTGAYFLYDFITPGANFPDYPKLGVWPDGYYMTTNQFFNGASFNGAGIFSFDRARMLAGDPAASFIYFNLDLASFPEAIGGMLPSDVDGLTPPSPGAPNVFAYFTAGEFGDVQGDALRVFDFHSDFANPSLSTFTERGDSPIAVAAFNPLTPAGRADIEQPPPALGTHSLDTIGDRLMHRLAYRNFGTHESLVVNHTVNVGTGTTRATHQAGVRYYEVRRNLPGNTFTVQEQATFAPDTDNRWMGSAAMDNQGNLAVGYSVSSLTTFPSIRYAGRLATDPPGGLFQGESTLIAGTGVQRSTGSRWGDYSAMNVDPSDDCTFWYTQEYYTAASQATSTVGWLTRVGSFKFASCTPAPKGTIQGVVTNAVTGLPIAGAFVQTSNGYSRFTDATGNYSMTVVPGTYNMMASKPSFQSATASGVAVTDGGTTIQNFALTPIPVITAAGSTITAECCSRNGAIDPGETVTVSLALKNVGQSDTKNLIATLQSTGGVTAPSGNGSNHDNDDGDDHDNDDGDNHDNDDGDGDDDDGDNGQACRGDDDDHDGDGAAKPGKPVSYGKVRVGGPAVSRKFTFKANASCGGTITATLKLRDGNLDLGTATFTFFVGTVSNVTATANYSSGNLNTPILDFTTIEVPITVSDAGVVDDVNVRIRLNHTFDADLDIALVGPDGTIVDLSSGNGGGGDNFGTGAMDCSGTPTVFDDAAVNPIATGVAPFAGTFSPEQPLATFNGKPSQGTWKLRITDNFGLDEGLLFCFQLEIRRKLLVCCTPGGTPTIVADSSTLKAESFSPANGAPDPGETVTMAFALRNIGSGDTRNLEATLLATGGVTAPSGHGSGHDDDDDDDHSGSATPPGRSVSYGRVPVGNPAVSRKFRFKANGTCGGTITATLKLRDGRTNLGTVSFTLTLGTTATTSTSFANPAPIIINDAPRVSGVALATPYPSTIAVSGVTGTVSKVTATIHNFSHTWPDDVDILLVGPGGQKVMLMSDAGDGLTYDLVNATLTFDDAAAASVPITAIPSNAATTYRPTNIGVIDPFLAPAPAAPYGSALSAFNGVNPNGTWSLYVVDDIGGDAGSIAGGFSLTISTSAPVCVAPPLARMLIIDEDGIDNGHAPNFFSTRNVGDQIVDVGRRAQLPIFAESNVGSQITLHTGQVGNRGWFSLGPLLAGSRSAGRTEIGRRTNLARATGIRFQQRS